MQGLVLVEVEEEGEQEVQLECNPLKILYNNMFCYVEYTLAYILLFVCEFPFHFAISLVYAAQVLTFQLLSIPDPFAAVYTWL